MRLVLALFLALLLTAGLLTVVGPTSVSADCYVSGYYTSRGTWVNGYYRTCADNNMWNNYSTKGNYNPYTGRKGYIDPYESYRSSGDSYRSPYNSGYNSYRSGLGYSSGYGSYRSSYNSGYNSYRSGSRYSSGYNSYDSDSGW